MSYYCYRKATLKPLECVIVFLPPYFPKSFNLITQDENSNNIQLSTTKIKNNQIQSYLGICNKNKYLITLRTVKLPLPLPAVE